jgi:hypothetical protein
MIRILPTDEPLPPSAARLTKTAALAALIRLEGVPLPEQLDKCLRAVPLAGLETYWTCDEVAPATYVRSVFGGTTRLFLLNESHDVAGVYEGSGDLWRRRAVTANLEIVAALLPRRALSRVSGDLPASSKQVAALRKIFELPPERTLPALHCAMASRLLDRVLFDKHLTEIVRDFDATVEQRAYDHAA